jgi:1-acyl-sn-glycerol-3-phosphate acyltransferase
MVTPGPLQKAVIVVGALLAVVCIAFAVGARAALPLHAAMLIGLLIVAFAGRRHPLVISLAVVAILMTLYQTIAEPAFVLMGHPFDATLAGVDRALLFGRDPALIAAPFAHGATLEFFSFVYGIFIPYLWLSIVLGCFGRPAAERDVFVFGLANTYALAYLGYLFVPSRGPVEWYAFAAPLHGGRFHELVLQSVAATGGNHGAFPSLHVGASAYLCAFDLRRNPLRGLTYLPVVALIAVSTVLLRYHYVIDIVAGLAIALFAHVIVWRPVPSRRPASPLFSQNALALLARAGVRLFFDHVEIDGAEHIPTDGPLLVVANHTNGLADGLMLLNVLPRRASLTAKSTLAKNPLLAVLMRLGGVVSFYRQQDAVDTRKNVDAFAAIRERLAGGEAICIFPEGVSHSDAGMRELRSGAARIALDFVERAKSSDRGERTFYKHTPLQILPIGLHYDAKQRFRSSVLVRIGAPIRLDASDRMTARDLTQLVDTRIRALTANFRRVREALWLRWTAELLATGGDDPKPLDQESLSVAERARLLDALRVAYDAADRGRVASIYASLRAYRRDLRRLGVAQHEVYLSMHPAQAAFFVLRELELLVAGAAIVMVGLVQHGLAFLADRALTRKLSVDLDHWASNAIFYGFAIFPLTWLIGLAVSWRLGSPLVALGYALLLPYTLVYLVLWQERIGRAVRRARTFLRFAVHRDLQRDLQQRGRALIREIRESRETKGMSPSEGESS